MVSFAEPEKLTLIFDSDQRQSWQNTSHIIDYLSIKSGEVIADLGAGTGYFCHQFLNHTPAAKIYALDVEPNMCSYLQQRFADEPKVICAASEPQDPQLPGDVDLVFMANTYRFITERQTFLTRLGEQLPIHARVVIVDFKGAQGRVPPEEVLKEVINAGFEIYHYERDTCPDHYLLSFRLCSSHHLPSHEIKSS